MGRSRGLAHCGVIDFRVDSGPISQLSTIYKED